MKELGAEYGLKKCTNAHFVVADGKCLKPLFHINKNCPFHFPSVTPLPPPQQLSLTPLNGPPPCLPLANAVSPLKKLQKKSVQ